MNVLLISTYELGRQPFGLASPAAFLKRAGARVTCADLSVEHLNDDALRAADLIAFFLPMHTATRLAIPHLRRARELNPRAHLCAYGLYAPLNEKYLRALGVETILGGEFEEQLVDLHRAIASRHCEHIRGVYPERSEWTHCKPCGERSESIRDEAIPESHNDTAREIPRQKFLIPDRAQLPALEKYARLNARGESRVTGYTEASRGCKHLCRHCPIVPVYRGQFRVVQREVVLADIRQQIQMGAQHITLPIVRELHREFPNVTYDATIKIEHLLQHADQLPTLRDTGCLFVTSAVEAVDDRILKILDKGHTRADFIRVAEIFRELQMNLAPTFVAFNPWISLEGYRDLLALIAELDLVEHVAPIQYAIRLLIPARSRLLELPEVRALIGAYDEVKLCYAWRHPDSRVDELHADVLPIIQAAQKENASRREIFARVWARAYGETYRDKNFSPAQPIPHLSEPWYC
ncbi:MAG: radical SAM protein [Chloroflexi bacterium]|nr:radical SAM protein [Chloroflexota bacterium]